MAEQVNSHSAMAKARHTDGLNVIFDQKSPGSSHSRSRSRSSSSSSSRSSRSSGSGHYKRRGRRDRSSSSSSSCSTSRSRSSSRSRSRSHPRCRRRSSCCRCDEHKGRSGRRHYRRSPSRRYRAHSRSYSRSPSPDRYYRRRRYSRSRSRSLGRWRQYRRPVSPLRFRFSPSPYRTYRSRSRSPVRSVSLSLDEKRRLLEAAKANAMKILGVEKIELPESVKPILSEEPEPRPLSPEPPFRRRHVSERTGPQDRDVDPDVSSPMMSPKRHIAFSTNNSMAKPTAAAPSPAKLTSRVDSYESRKPYGSWIPIGSGQSARK
ncbi:arginine/serine-rich protein 1 [Oryzias melastigma]|uniref:arginine/serine-rich protein 1 n=1 Tax=Oryzias melastigma TaxID=30732 RepID=UPI000CF83EA2|nr:arginine/serine-rich protein 1 [Oryzias melastigma]